MTCSIVSASWNEHPTNPIHVRKDGPKNTNHNKHGRSNTGIYNLIRALRPLISSVHCCVALPVTPLISKTTFTPFIPPIFGIKAGTDERKPLARTSSSLYSLLLQHHQKVDCQRLISALYTCHLHSSWGCGDYEECYWNTISLSMNSAIHNWRNAREVLMRGGKHGYERRSCVGNCSVSTP